MSEFSLKECYTSKSFIGTTSQVGNDKNLNSKITKIQNNESKLTDLDKNEKSKVSVTHEKDKNTAVDQDENIEIKSAIDKNIQIEATREAISIECKDTSIDPTEKNKNEKANTTGTNKDEESIADGINESGKKLSSERDENNIVTKIDKNTGIKTIEVDKNKKIRLTKEDKYVNDKATEDNMKEVNLSPETDTNQQTKLSEENEKNGSIELVKEKKNDTEVADLEKHEPADEMIGKKHNSDISNNVDDNYSIPKDSSSLFKFDTIDTCDSISKDGTDSHLKEEYYQPDRGKLASSSKVLTKGGLNNMNYEMNEDLSLSVTPFNDRSSETELGCFMPSDDEALPQSLIAFTKFKVPKQPMLNHELQISKRSSLKRPAEDDLPVNGSKRKRTIQFNGVTVFYFPRSQGFTCVPSQGGSTLGMSRHHFLIKEFSLSEHAAEQRKSHRDFLRRVHQQKHSQKKEIGSQCSSSEDSEENSEEASDISDSELESDSFFFLQPLPIRQRRALLRQSGIRQIEGVEKEECKDIRLSREMCGCQCRMYCSSDTCQCAEAGIKCQVDRHNFPCGCSREGCQNPNGRIEFNPIRVRTHFLHTLMRLEIEKRQSSDASWMSSKSSNQQLVDISWGAQAAAAHSSPDNFVLNGTLRRQLSFLNGNGDPLQASKAQNAIIPNHSGSSMTVFDHSNKEEGSYQNNRDYDPTNCNMVIDRFSCPFNPLTPMSSLEEPCNSFPSDSSFSSCYHSHSFSKFASCSSPLSSSHLQLQFPGSPFSIEPRRAANSNSLLPVASPCINLANLLPQDDANSFPMNDFSTKSFVNKYEDNVVDKGSTSSLFSVLENLDTFAIPNELPNHAGSCFANCSDALSHLQSSPLNGGASSCSKPTDSYGSLQVDPFSSVKKFNPMALKDSPFMSEKASSSCAMSSLGSNDCTIDKEHLPLSSILSAEECSKPNPLFLKDSDKVPDSGYDTISSANMEVEDNDLNKNVDQNSMSGTSNESPPESFNKRDQEGTLSHSSSLDSSKMASSDAILASTDINSNSNSLCSSSLECVPKCSLSGASCVEEKPSDDSFPSTDSAIILESECSSLTAVAL